MSTIPATLLAKFGQLACVVVRFADQDTCRQAVALYQQTIGGYLRPKPREDYYSFRLETGGTPFELLLVWQKLPVFEAATMLYWELEVSEYATICAELAALEDFYIKEQDK